MGGSWSRESAWQSQAWATEDDVKGAIAGFEEWQKKQDASKVNQRSLPTNGPLLDRMGGVDQVKKVAEVFYRKMYADERLSSFLGNYDVVSLRAKQNAFLTWAFGPPNRPYPGRHMRTAHLRLILQQGFTAEHFDLGLAHFQEALREMEMPEKVIKDVMTKLRPYKTVVFTPSPARDSEEELRWVKEERMKEERALKQQSSQKLLSGDGTATNSNSNRSNNNNSAPASSSRPTSAAPSRPASALTASRFGATAAAAATTAAVPERQRGAVSDSGQSAGSALGAAAAGAAGNGASTSISGPGGAAASGPQCPFSGGRLVRPLSTSATSMSASGATNATTPTSEAAGSPVPTPTRSPASKSAGSALLPQPGPLSRVSASTLPPPPSMGSPARAGPSSRHGSFTSPITTTAHGSFTAQHQLPLPPALAGLLPPPPLQVPLARTSGASSGSGTPRSSREHGEHRETRETREPSLLGGGGASRRLSLDARAVPPVPPPLAPVLSASSAAPNRGHTVRASPVMAWGAQPTMPAVVSAATAAAVSAAEGGMKKLAPPAAVAREGSVVAGTSPAATTMHAVERRAVGSGGASGSGTAGTGTGTGTGSHSPIPPMQFMKPPSPGNISGMSSPGQMKRL